MKRFIFKYRLLLPHYNMFFGTRARSGMLKICLAACTAYLFTGMPAAAQELAGFNYNNYGGVVLVPFNPANAAGNRLGFDLNVVTVSMAAGNNQYRLSRSAIERGFKGIDKNNGSLIRITGNRQPRSAWFSAAFQLPSMLITLSPKHAVALTTRIRSIQQVHNLSYETASLIGTDFEETSLYGKDIVEKNFSIATHTFGEAGLTYARVIRQDQRNLLKAGVTVKALVPGIAGYFRAKDLLVNLKNDSLLNHFRGNVTLNYTKGVNDFDELDQQFEAVKKLQNLGVGFDAGLVWQLNNSRFSDSTTAIHYAVRIGVAVTDIGSITYKNSSGSKQLRFDKTHFPTEELSSEEGESFEMYTRRLASTLGGSQGPASFKMKLPTALRLNADWHLSKKLFLNANATVPISAMGGAMKALTLTPRFEGKAFALMLPFTVNSYQGKLLGAFIRVGPWFIGSGSVISNLLSDASSQADVYAGFKIQFARKTPKKAHKAHKVVPAGGDMQVLSFP